MVSVKASTDSNQPETQLLDIQLLGRFQVFRGKELIPESAWSRRKASILFKILILSPNRRRHKEKLLDLLWPDLDPIAATNNLHKTLYHLRRILCPTAADAHRCPYVGFDDEMVVLGPHLVSQVDIEQFEAQAAKALTSAKPASYTAALDLYAGDLLPEDQYEEWAIPRREALHHLYLTLLRQLGELHLTRREYETAIVVWGQVLATEPADEEAHRALMQAYALSGQRHQALRQYHLCYQTLADELDIEPLPETAALYQAVLTGEIAPEPTPALSQPLRPVGYKLIGREAEMKTLLAVLDRTAESGPRLAIIAGEAGVGKTRLAQEVARQASERGLPVLAGATYESVGTLDELPLPYGPLVEALRHFLAVQPAEVRQHLIGPWQADLARLLPELGGASPASAFEPEVAQRRLFEAVAHLLGAIAVKRPLLLVLDDLHAVDQASLELLGYLIHRPPPFRVLVLALARQEGVQPAPTPLTHVLARAERRGLLTRLTLAPLTPAQTAQLVHDRLPGLVEEAVTGAVHEASEGNPLFAEQLLHAWQEEGAIVAKEERWQLRFPEQPLPLPITLRETIILRLARLSSTVQEMLALAAVVGREFRYDWLLAAGPWDESTLLNLLDEALQTPMLEEAFRRAGPLFYRFQHGLIRQTLYENLSAARRRYLHLQLAEALEGMTDVPGSARAHHWFAAGRWPWAFCYALTAAEQALPAFAHAEAVSLYDRALAAAGGNWSVDDDLLARVHTGRAKALMGVSRFGEAVTDLQWLADRAQATADRTAEGHALSQLAIANFWDHNLDTARHHAQEALDIAQETGDKITATTCTSVLGSVALCIGHLDQGTQILETGLKQGRALEQPALLIEALTCLVGAYHWQGNSARSVLLWEEAIAIARQEAMGFWLGNLLFSAGLAHGSLGHYEQALDYFRQGQQHSHDVGDTFTLVRVANSLGWIYHELYDMASAIRFDRQGIEMARSFPWPEPLGNGLVNLGFDYLAVGETVQAERCFVEATDLLPKDEWMRWRWHTRLLLGQGKLALTRQDLDQAVAHTRQALALAEETAARKNQARAYRLLGEIALAAGESANGVTFLQQADALVQVVDNPYLRWQTLAALARAHTTEGDDQAATAAWSQAAQVIHTIAANLHDEALKRVFLKANPVQAVLGREAKV